MLEILIGFVTTGIKEILANAVSFGANKFATRRTLLASLLRLFNSIDDLERAADNLQKELNACANGSTTPSIVISYKRLDVLRIAFSRFVDRSSATRTILEIFDPRLSGMISSSKNLKYSFWASVDVTDQVLPSMELDGKKRKTFVVSFPTELPPRSAFGVIDPSLGIHGDIKEKKELFERSLIEQFRRSTVNLRDRETLDKINIAGNEALGSLGEAKANLAALIRSNFDLDKIVT